MTIDDFTKGYIECALWSSTGDDGTQLDENHGIEDLAPETLVTMIEDCRQFQETYAEDLAQADSRHGSAGHGHDFWLTRNRHGAGFWDRGYGAVGQRLTDAAHAEGSVDLYIGDDGKIYS